jgi:hypothetical protein
MIILNVVLMALIATAIVGLCLWSILTQHRDPSYQDVIRRRLHVSVRLVPLELPKPRRVDSPRTLAREI